LQTAEPERGGQHATIEWLVTGDEQQGKHFRAPKPTHFRVQSQVQSQMQMRARGDAGNAGDAGDTGDAGAGVLVGVGVGVSASDSETLAQPIKRPMRHLREHAETLYQRVG
jgi:hypothetical protein